LVNFNNLDLSEAKLADQTYWSVGLMCNDQSKAGAPHQIARWSDLLHGQ